MAFLVDRFNSVLELNSTYRTSLYRLESLFGIGTAVAYAGAILSFYTKRCVHILFNTPVEYTTQDITLQRMNITYRSRSLCLILKHFLAILSTLRYMVSSKSSLSVMSIAVAES